MSRSFTMWSKTNAVNLTMNSRWEYTNTKISREFNQQNYSSHLNDMGSQGWDLVTVDTYAYQRLNLLYWKSPQHGGFWEGMNNTFGRDLAAKRVAESTMSSCLTKHGWKR